MEQLLEVPTIDPNSRDQNGRTPLSWAVSPEDRWKPRSEDSVHVTELLLRHKDIKINLVDDRGWTPLSWAVQRQGGDDIVDLLLATTGVDVNYRDTEGLTPLSIAENKGCELAMAQLKCVPGIEIDSNKTRKAAKWKRDKQATKMGPALTEKRFRTNSVLEAIAAIPVRASQANQKNTICATN